MSSPERNIMVEAMRRAKQAGESLEMAARWISEDLFKAGYLFWKCGPDGAMPPAQAAPQAPQVPQGGPQAGQGGPPHSPQAPGPQVAAGGSKRFGLHSENSSHRLCIEQIDGTKMVYIIMDDAARGTELKMGLSERAIAGMIDFLHTVQGSNIVLIWSGEHQAWWKPAGSGYTNNRDEAGRWWIEDARRTTAHCGPDKRIQFHAANSNPRVVVVR